MSLTRAVTRGRRAAERLMTDTCVVRHKTGTVFNESTGQYDDQFADVYTGRCRVQANPLWQPGTPESAGWTATVTGYVVSLPVSEAGFAVDDVVEVTASAYDSGLVGRQLRVTSVQTKSHATARRLVCEVIEA